MNSFDDVDFNLSFNNFSPEEIQTDETINAVFAVDISPSVHAYVDELNDAFNEFVRNMQQSHVADRLMISVLEFNQNVNVRFGFRPVTGIPETRFVPSGVGTALYDAIGAAMDRAIDYRENLENSGVDCKTLLFVISDGMDNSSKSSAKTVKKQIDAVMAEEQNAFSFTTVLFGVGDAAGFEKAQQETGIRHLARVGTTGDEIRRMIGFISRSVSSAAGNQQITF